MTKFFAIVLAVAVTYTEARTLRMSRGNSCSCRHRIQRERDNAVKKHNEIAENFDRLSEFVSMTNCEEGYVFNYEASTHDTSKVLCEKCPENHYRAYNNGTCLHCPEGYIASKGSSRCKRADMNDLIHTLCPLSSVVGDNPFGIHRDSCKKCDIEKKKNPNLKFQARINVFFDEAIADEGDFYFFAFFHDHLPDVQSCQGANICETYY